MITVTRVIYIDSKSSKVVNDTFQSVKEAKDDYVGQRLDRQKRIF